jgi:hypothetical protein
VVTQPQRQGTKHMSEQSPYHKPTSRPKRPWFHYLLLWPIVLDADKDKRNGRLLTPREWLGWGIVAVVIVLAVALT